jgi:hypothetical protein
VPSGSRGLGDRLRSFNFCMGRSIGSHQQRWMQYPRRRPIASPLEVCVRRPRVRRATIMGPASAILHMNGSRRFIDQWRRGLLPPGEQSVADVTRSRS